MNEKHIAKRVLFAHQSTIPHYRIPFYNVLEKKRPSTWSFDVVFDPEEFVNPRIFKEPISPDSFDFSFLPTSTHFLRFGEKRVVYQSFLAQAGHYDLLILEDAVNNLTYPLCQLHQLHKVKVALWGHGRDRKVTKMSPVKQASEVMKLWRCRQADGFFAYTQGVKNFLVENGVSARKIWVANNTIDILDQRSAFERHAQRRQAWRQQLGLTDKKVMLFVGRFSKNKRLDFLFRACSLLEQQRSDTHLIVVGSGALPPDELRPQRLTLFDSTTEVEKLAPIYVGSDLFVCPGAVGLAPLQALCYDLPVVTLAQSTHGPEVEYLSPQNSLMLPEQTTPADYTDSLQGLFSDAERLTMLRRGCWPSIRQYTIEAMAQNFIDGINTLLFEDERIVSLNS